MGSHSEGSNTNATGQNSHAEGSNCTSEGDASHAGGKTCVAKGESSFVHGKELTVESGTKIIIDGHEVNFCGATAFGQYNKSDNTDLIFMIGNGGYYYADGSEHIVRKNAFAVDKDGYIYCAGIKDSEGTEINFVPYPTSKADELFKSIMG